MRHYKYATRYFVKRLDIASHAVAIAVATSGIIAVKWELDLAAGAAWLFLQGCTIHCAR
ncbi:hypothetical protein HER14_06500 [Acidithiobacillus thiooxidans]|uniref:hypothetical protein n=1 Tax=Acidithiobacillus thiooxidans TaxID=930 RepID=UPI001C0704E4|nr:hypothetical protein [Acidithiobacillus thiooxidans]MBU2750601.1 hypothetical protein [Acidithiobacillus thiooxidans]MBU2836239.1 hypothetical protein [Acidithiobacillus thiooxidans]